MDFTRKDLYVRTEIPFISFSKEGVKFQSPHDGKEMLLTPEKSTEIQNSIGADIIMQLDDVVSSTTTGNLNQYGNLGNLLTISFKDLSFSA